MPAYAYAMNNPIRYADRTGLDYDNPVCWVLGALLQLGHAFSWRPMQNEGHKQGDSQCICYVREHPPAGAGTDECFYKPVDFNPDEPSCPPELKSGLSACDSYCKTMAKSFPVKPEASGWKSTTCPSQGSFSCGGQKIDKYVDKHSCY